MSQKKTFKFIFIASIESVSLALKFPCVVSVIWKRGQKASEIKQRKQIIKGIANFNQKLQLECNMSYDVKSKTFEEKKTKFTVLIFSEKGNKQAGEIYIDVSDILNKKQKSIKYSTLLEKCPDKNAKLNLELTTYLKAQITPDQVSMASTKTYDIQASINDTKPDFKKKKKQPQMLQPINQPPPYRSVIKDDSQQPKSQKTIIIKDANKVQLLRAQQQNKKLKQQLKQLKQLQLENENLKRQYEEGERKSSCYYKKKYDEIKKQYQQIKEKSDNIKNQIKKKNQLEKQMCDCKESMGRLLNYALMSNNNQLAEQFYNIYQMKA